MNKIILLACSSIVVIAGCSNTNHACEDITLASEQIQQCQVLQRQISNAKGQPLVRTELERRYENDCINGRFYRDEHQMAICGNKKEIADRVEEVIEKKNN